MDCIIDGVHKGPRSKPAGPRPHKIQRGGPARLALPPGAYFRVGCCQSEWRRSRELAPLLSEAGRGCHWRLVGQGRRGGGGHDWGTGHEQRSMIFSARPAAWLPARAPPSPANTYECRVRPKGLGHRVEDPV